MRLINEILEFHIIASMVVAHSPGLVGNRRENFLGLTSATQGKTKQKEISWLQAFSAARKLQLQSCDDVSGVTAESCNEVVIDCPTLSLSEAKTNNEPCPDGFSSLTKCICHLKGAMLDEIREKGDDSGKATLNYGNRAMKLANCLKDVMSKKQVVIDAFRDDTHGLFDKVNEFLKPFVDDKTSLAQVDSLVKSFTSEIAHHKEVVQKLENALAKLDPRIRDTKLEAELETERDRLQAATEAQADAEAGQEKQKELLQKKNVFESAKTTLEKLEKEILEGKVSDSQPYQLAADKMGEAKANLAAARQELENAENAATSALNKAKVTTARYDKLKVHGGNSNSLLSLAAEELLRESHNLTYDVDEKLDQSLAFGADEVSFDENAFLSLLEQSARSNLSHEAKTILAARRTETPPPMATSLAERASSSKVRDSVALYVMRSKTAEESRILQALKAHASDGSFGNVMREECDVAKPFSAPVSSTEPVPQRLPSDDDSSLLERQREILSRSSVLEHMPEELRKEIRDVLQTS